MIRRLTQATKLENEANLQLESLVEAVEEREETAQTLVADGFAMPHAFCDWDGEFCAVLGWSRDGIDFGAADESGLVHLALLLIFGRKGREKHLEYLAAFAEFFAEESFRSQLVDVTDVATVERVIQKRAGIGRKAKPPKLPKVNSVLLKNAVSMVSELSAQAILIATDKLEFIPWNPVAEWPGRILIVTPDEQGEFPKGPADIHLIDVPKVSLTRNDRANLGLLIAAAKGLVASDANVVCLAGSDGRRFDSLTVNRPPVQFRNVFLTSNRRRPILPSVILRVISLALEIADEGREGKALGTVFVVGDTRRVRRHTTQLVLNPFHGYSRHLRSILDPSLGETVKEFALLDGAFVVQDDGMVVSAGTYIIPKIGKQMTSGLGARHQAAASITSHTHAVAVVVSQSTGTVLVMRHGKIVLKLERSGAAVN